MRNVKRHFQSVLLFVWITQHTLLNPFSDSLSSKDQKIALAASIILGVATLGTVLLGRYAAKKFSSNFSNKTSQKSNGIGTEIIHQKDGGNVGRNLRPHGSVHIHHTSNPKTMPQGFSEWNDKSYENVTQQGGRALAQNFVKKYNSIPEGERQQAVDAFLKKPLLHSPHGANYVKLLHEGLEGKDPAVKASVESAIESVQKSHPGRMESLGLNKLLPEGKVKSEGPFVKDPIAGEHLEEQVMFTDDFPPEASNLGSVPASIPYITVGDGYVLSVEISDEMFEKDCQILNNRLRGSEPAVKDGQFNLTLTETAALSEVASELTRLSETAYVVGPDLSEADWNRFAMCANICFQLTGNPMYGLMVLECKEYIEETDVEELRDAYIEKIVDVARGDLSALSYYAVFAIKCESANELWRDMLKLMEGHLNDEQQLSNQPPKLQAKLYKLRAAYTKKELTNDYGPVAELKWIKKAADCGDAEAKEVLQKYSAQMGITDLAAAVKADEWRRKGISPMAQYQTYEKRVRGELEKNTSNQVDLQNVRSSAADFVLQLEKKGENDAEELLVIAKYYTYEGFSEQTPENIKRGAVACLKAYQNARDDKTKIKAKMDLAIRYSNGIGVSKNQAEGRRLMQGGEPDMEKCLKDFGIARSAI